MNRKYIPADVDQVDFAENCSKVFVDVFSESIESPGAFVCCDDASLSQFRRRHPREQQYYSDICTPPVSFILCCIERDLASKAESEVIQVRVDPNPTNTASFLSLLAKLSHICKTTLKIP